MTGCEALASIYCTDRERGGRAFSFSSSAVGADIYAVKSQSSGDAAVDAVLTACIGLPKRIDGCPLTPPSCCRFRLGPRETVTNPDDMLSWWTDTLKFLGFGQLTRWVCSIGWFFGSSAFVSCAGGGSSPNGCLQAQTRRPNNYLSSNARLLFFFCVCVTIIKNYRVLYFIS